MRSGNPTLNANTFESFGAFAGTGSLAPATAMTIAGTVHKTLFLLALAFGSACFTWSRAFAVAEAGGEAGLGSVAPWVLGGAIVGLIAALATCFKPDWARFLAPVYALAEGLFLGGISAGFESVYPGIVLQAIGCTFGTMFCLLLAYQSGLIRATENFKLGIVAATGGIAMVYLVAFVMGMIFPGNTFNATIFGSGLIGIGVSVFVVAIAALNLVLDFDFIEQAAARGAPRQLEWYGAFALMVTLVWLYLEILRLIAKLQDRR